MPECLRVCIVGGWGSRGGGEWSGLGSGASSDTQTQQQGGDAGGGRGGDEGRVESGRARQAAGGSTHPPLSGHAPQPCPAPPAQSRSAVVAAGCGGTAVQQCSGEGIDGGPPRQREAGGEPGGTRVRCGTGTLLLVQRRRGLHKAMLQSAAAAPTHRTAAAVHGGTAARSWQEQQ